MAFKLPNAVQETSSTTGTGTLDLDGAVTNRLAFASQLSNNDTTIAVIDDGSDFEVSVCTYTNTSGEKLSRDTVLFSTNGGGKVDWPSGTRNVFVGLPGMLVASLLAPSSADGFLVQTADNTYARRTLTASGNLSIADGNGVNGNPAISLSEGAGSGLDADTLDGKQAAEFIWDTDLGSVVQAWAQSLDQLAALARTDGNFIVGNGSAWVAEGPTSARSSLGLGGAATKSVGNTANDVAPGAGSTVYSQDADFYAENSTFTTISGRKTLTINTSFGTHDFVWGIVMMRQDGFSSTDLKVRAVDSGGVGTALRFEGTTGSLGGSAINPSVPPVGQVTFEIYDNVNSDNRGVEYKFWARKY